MIGSMKEAKIVPIFEADGFINTMEGNVLYAACLHSAGADMGPYENAKAAWEAAQR